MKPVSFGLVLFLAWHGMAAAGERERTSKDCDPADRTYFPVEQPDSETSGLDAFQCDWFSKHLRSMNEPPLLGREQEKDARAYRLLVLPSFDRPYALRLEPEPGGRWRLAEKATDGSGGYDAGKVTFEKSRLLTKDEAAPLIRVLEAIDLDRTVTDISFVEETDPETGEEYALVPTDGTELVFEAVRNGRYRVFTRHWSEGFLEPEFERLVEAFENVSPYMRARVKDDE